MADEPKQAEKTDESDEQNAPEGHGRPPNILTRPTDHPARPGFRSPANQKSKAQKKQRSGGKKRGR